MRRCLKSDPCRNPVGDFLSRSLRFSLQNKGVKLMLDAVIDYLPSPVEVPQIKGHNKQGKEVTVIMTTTRNLSPWPSRS